MTNGEQKFQDAAQRRDRALRDLIHVENDKSHYNGRIESLRDIARTNPNPQKQVKAERLANHFEQKVDGLKEKQEKLKNNYVRAKHELDQQIATVKDPDARMQLKQQSQGRQEDVHLKEAGKTLNQNNRKNMRTTLDFMERKGFNQNDIQHFTRGTDFSKKISVERREVGSQMTQRVKNGKGPGNYYTDPGTSASRAGISNSNRKHRRYEATKPMEVLRSKAAAVPDAWTNPKRRQPTRGGNTQYLVAKSDQTKLKDITHAHKVKNSPRKKVPTTTAANKKNQHAKTAVVRKRNIIRRKGAQSDLAVKNGRGVRVHKNTNKPKGPKL